MSDYALVDLFRIRVAGAPLDEVERMATKESAQLARELRSLQKELDGAATEALASLSAYEGDRRRLARKLQKRLAIPPSDIQALARYAELHRACEEKEAALASTLARESQEVRAALRESAKTTLNRYLVFSSESMAREAEDDGGDDGEKRERQRDRRLFMYLQRVCAKNETISEFGPSSWGTVEEGAFRFAPEPGIAARDTFLESWAVEALVGLLNSDARLRPELAPRLHPDGRLEGTRFVREDRGEAMELSSAEAALAARCDGTTPAYALDALDLLESLAQRGVVVWRFESPPMTAHRLPLLIEKLRDMRDGPGRSHWLPLLEALQAEVTSFGADGNPERRSVVMRRVRSALSELGIAQKQAGRSLGAGANAIGEECVRRVDFVVTKQMADALVEGASPWFDLWRDTFMLAGGRVNARLRTLAESAPRTNGRISLPAFARHCAANGFALFGGAVPSLAAETFAEVRAAFREELAGRPDANEWALTKRELHVVRRRFQFERVEGYTWPSADLQICARSPEAVAKGEYRWVIAELHTAMALLQHAGYWACPDRKRLSAGLKPMLGATPLATWSDPPSLPAHNALHYADALEELWTWTGPQAPLAGWQAVRPADTDVVVDPNTGDVQLRDASSGRVLRSFARTWGLQFGLHPFVPLSLPGHTPRLSVGGVIVQRETWTLLRDELPVESGGGVDPMLLVAVAALRERRGLPRFIYVRPPETVLKRATGGGRDKDVKPVYLDLDAYLGAEILVKWLEKYGELEAAEMLPAPDDTPWIENGQRYSFELRTLVGPRH